MPSAIASPALPAYTAVLLAGGQGVRMGGADKGLQFLAGQPLVRHVLQRLQQQSHAPQQLLISANRNLPAYARLGVAVHPDAVTDRPGPLAGFLTGLQQAGHDWLLVVPCDAPLLPLDLAERLLRAALEQDADLAMAWAPDPQGRLQAQPVFCLLHARLQASLLDYLDQGGRKAGHWIGQQRTASVPFDKPGDEPLAFVNLNTLGQLNALEQSLAAPSRPEMQALQ